MAAIDLSPTVTVRGMMFAMVKNAPKRPRDPNQLGKAIVEIATGARNDTVPPKSPMSELGREGGKKGGAARAATMTPERRKEIARLAAEKRWQKSPRE